MKILEKLDFHDVDVSDDGIHVDRRGSTYWIGVNRWGDTKGPQVHVFLGREKMQELHRRIGDLLAESEVKA